MGCCSYCVGDLPQKKHTGLGKMLVNTRYSLIQLGLTLVSQERSVGREEILNFSSYNLFAFPYAPWRTNFASPFMDGIKGILNTFGGVRCWKFWWILILIVFRGLLEGLQNVCWHIQLNSSEKPRKSNCFQAAKTSQAQLS